MTAEEYKARFGLDPNQDDLERANCRRVGNAGHWLCGVCATHDRPRFMCGCMSHRTPDEGPHMPRPIKK